MIEAARFEKNGNCLELTSPFFKLYRTGGRSLVKRVRDVDLRLLRVFVAVVEAGGYAGAQATLNVGSSTISLHMSDLEKRLGFRLCERGRNGFRLNERGRAVYDETKRLLAMLDDFSGSMAALRKRIAGKLVLGTVDCLVSHPDFPLVRALRRFNELDHDVHVELVIASRAELERAVTGGQMHAAIVPYVRKVSGLDFLPILEEHHQLYCGAGHPFFDPSRGEPTTAEIARAAFVVRSYHEQFDSARVPAEAHRATVHDMEGMLILLLTGSYVGFLPDHYARPWVERGQLRPVEARDFSYVSRHMLITAASARPSTALSTFLSLLEEPAAPPDEAAPQPVAAH